ncbi:MAG TPA: PP2C family serine/threonine-protein phosphatase [Burkholderiaceae bacterium]|nr:PP2C family serine/threonine-protein phosphatase [Burkholderiaceae bacterium]
MSSEPTMKWKVFFASATGKYHLTSNIPCQDAGHFVVMGDVLIGAVCDGAGSASQGQAGADFFAKTVTELIAESVKAKELVPGAQPEYREQLRALIERARARLGEIAASQELELRDFSCTLVGCISSPEEGCLFHIGDGFAVYLRDTGESVVSQPENGEYADQTYFVTDKDWQEHLRVTQFREVNRGGLIGLMSDGASPFAINRMRTGFYRPFIDPVATFLSSATEQNGNQALQKVLEDEKTHAITTDDKTLLLALAS